MRLNFKRIEIHNFMCFEDEVFEFNKLNGLTLVCGKNNDIPGSKNGVGKCLDKDTKLTIEVNNDDLDKILSVLSNNGIGKEHK